MCIALVTTAHPSYSLIVIDNRDEYLTRPTSPPSWWPPPHNHVLSSRDLARAPYGTWMGVTKTGKLAVLTNYRETSAAKAAAAPQSRGVIVNSWLAAPPDDKRDTRAFVQDTITGIAARNVGGFSLVCGYVNEPLAIVSNRSANLEQVTWVAKERGETVGLSNTSFGDRSWPKIIDGERLVEEAIGANVEAGEGEDKLIERFLGVLSTDTLPRLPEGSSTETYIPNLRKSIFIPAIGAESKNERSADEVAAACVEDRVKVDGAADAIPNPAFMQGPYGTQKQTVLLVREDGRVRYFERTLYDNNVNAIPVGEGDQSFEFMVERES
ncbi:hypothetical protein SI65_08145 [Aspergillus cristatus]|uniref:Transport and Golgi organization protein 2 n=1 Tax=Aspergillus cristatus TaxID=573508 RepID=A0A1E3B6W5_ASPCR|nr:hypothetical protein SI65_08145 [Aspergillus cristatus]